MVKNSISAQDFIEFSKNHPDKTKNIVQRDGHYYDTTTGLQIDNYVAQMLKDNARSTNDINFEELKDYIASVYDVSPDDIPDEEVLADIGIAEELKNKIASAYNLSPEDVPDVFGSNVPYIDPSTQEELKKEYERQQQQSAKEAAYNSYYRDIYDYNTEGTLGNEIYNNLWQAEQNAAMSNMQLAEAQYQQAAMDQAAVVKSITDQVRAERMAKLRSGMNEAQIANQDMQLMLNNMNTLNQQVNTLNQNRLSAQQQLNLAQDTAYQQYLQQAAALGQVGAAYAASDAGDAYMQTLKRKLKTGESFSTANKYVTGQLDQNK